MYDYDYGGELAHHGIKGQKWGVRRFQNEDGSLTAAGKQRYAENYSKMQRFGDTMAFGYRGMKRINKKMKEGTSHQDAMKSEVKRKVVKTVATKAVSVAVSKYGAAAATACLTAAATHHVNRGSVERGEAAVYATFREIETGLVVR